MKSITTSQIERMIFNIRDQKVMLDTDLADLYEIKTGRMNEQVKRNLDRFPPDFMFQLTEDEFDQIKNVADPTDERWGGRRYLPYVFTECGVAMPSSVLSSPRAISVNISIMRTFVRLRSFLAMDNNLTERVDSLEDDVQQLFKAVFQKLDAIEVQISPRLGPNRKRIGLKND